MYIYEFSHKGSTYIGSTKNMKMRLHAHNQHKKQPRHNKCKFYQYCIEQEITDVRPFIEVICEIGNDISNTELRQIEQGFLDNQKPNLNMLRAIGQATKRKRKRNK